MSVFSHPELDGHEVVAFHHDPASGLKAIIAVHNTRLGPGLGGCRMYAYANDADALTDVLRLSRGMTYKAALAGLPQGGGKSVIIGDSRRAKTPALMRAMGRFVDTLGGRYIVAEDSGTSVADMKIIGESTRHVVGFPEAHAQMSARSGDPSPATAYGTFVGLQASVKFQLGRDSLKGLRVAVQGVGNVGRRLVKQLTDAGAKVWVTDTYMPAVEQCVQDCGATAVGMDEIYGLDVDVYAPCALGATLNDKTIPQLKAKVIAGAANNQLAEPRHGRALLDLGILYAPDYAINAGGIIEIYHETHGYDEAKAKAQLDHIGVTLTQIFERAKSEKTPTGEIADRMAEEIFKR